MRFNQIVGGLTAAEKQALDALEKSGRWGIMYDTRIEDGFRPDGQRSRTFQRSGRYPLVLMLDPGGSHPATGLFAEPEKTPEPEQVAVKADPVEIAPAPEPPEMKHTRPVAWVEPEVIVKKKKKK